MEAIIQDGLPKGCYEFQSTLSNRTRPDCVRVPARPAAAGDRRQVSARSGDRLRDAKTDEERKQAAQRLRTDVGKHVADIADKYLIPGETQEVALMFVPSESVYAELHDGFDDVVQKAYRAQVVIVSPSLLDAGDPGDAADPEGRPHARGGRQDSRRGRASGGGCGPPARARAQAAERISVRPSEDMRQIIDLVGKDREARRHGSASRAASREPKMRHRATGNDIASGRVAAHGR